jgi:hypothetical protein
MMPEAKNSSAAAEQQAGEPQYYVSDMAKASFRELWWIAKKDPRVVLGLAVILTAKMLRRPFRIGDPFSLFDTEFIEPSEIPEEVRRIQEPLMKPLKDAGFSTILATKKLQSADSEGYALVMRGADGFSMASVAFARIQNEDIQLQRAALGLSSRRRNGTTIITTNAARSVLEPPELKKLYLKHASPETVIARHERRISGFTDLVLVNREEVPGLMQKAQRRLVDFNIARGLYVLASAEELRRAGLISDTKTEQ